MPVHIYSHNEHSEGARALAGALGVRRIKHERSTYRGGPGKTVINWGASRLPENLNGARIINNPHRIAALSNKRSFFQIMDDTDVSIPDWTVDSQVAYGWLHEGHDVVLRYQLNGHSAAGVEIAKAADGRQNFLDKRPAPLYTKYVKKKYEYRIHFAFGRIIDIQRKIKDPNRDVRDWMVRNHANGFIFVRNGVEDALQRSVREQAELFIQESGLDFGAIDIIYNSQERQAYVLEVNTAPGLVGETVNSYATAFRELL